MSWLDFFVEIIISNLSEVIFPAFSIVEGEVYYIEIVVVIVGGSW